MPMTARDRNHGWGDERCRRYHDWLVGQGYQPTEIESELLRDRAEDDAA